MCLRRTAVNVGSLFLWNKTRPNTYLDPFLLSIEISNTNLFDSVDFTQVVALVLIHGEHCAGAHTSGVQVTYWTLQLLAYVIRVRSLSLQQPEVVSCFRYLQNIITNLCRL